MAGLLRDAWSGWLNYTSPGKLVVLFIVMAAYMALVVKPKGIQGRFVMYGIIAGVLCVLPPTAAVLMLYQTRFYDYRWIWSVVPVTALTALGGTIFLTVQWKGDRIYRPFWKRFLRNSALTLMCVGIVCLCGGLGGGEADNMESRKDAYEYAAGVLDNVRDICGDECCLWAPREILEYARTDGSIRLLYGRNMWDNALNAYSYDSYDEETGELYLWIESLEDSNEETDDAKARDYVQKAFARGVDCILLPKTKAGWEPSERMADNLRVIKTEGYYLLTTKNYSEK